MLLVYDATHFSLHTNTIESDCTFIIQNNTFNFNSFVKKII